MQLFEILQSLDEDIFHALNQAGSNAALDVLMTAFTIMGVSFVMATFVIALWLRDRKDFAIDYLVLIAFVSVLAEVIKVVTDRQRPFDVLPNINTISLLGFTSASGPSFPSGHAARAFAVAALLSFGRGPRTYVVSFALASCISVSRVYLGLHWPSDLLFGALLGIIAAFLIESCAGADTCYGRARTRLVHFLERLPGTT